MKYLGQVETENKHGKLKWKTETKSVSGKAKYLEMVVTDLNITTI